MPDTGIAPKTKAQRRVEATEALLDAAEELIARYGLAGATVARIGHHAGYSRGMVTHYFGEKKKLVEALIDRQRRTFLNSTRVIEGNSGLDCLVKVIDGYVEAFAAGSTYTRAYFSLRSSAYPEEGDDFDIPGYDDECREIVESWIRRGHSDGSIRPDVSLESGARLCLALGRGLGEQILVSPNAVDVAELKSQTRRFLMGALAPRVEQDGRRA